MPPRCWLFDLDNTLYPAGCGLFDLVDANINRYLEVHLGLDAATADALRERYHEEHGLTLIGLMREHGVDPAHYMEFVHRVPVRELLAPDQEVHDILAGLPGRRVIFTNGSREHSLSVLGALGLGGVFDEIFDIVRLGYIPKPDPRTYRAMISSLGVTAAETVFLDDLPRNLAPARQLGMRTVLVGGPPQPGAADFQVRDLCGLRAVMPALLA